MGIKSKGQVYAASVPQGNKLSFCNTGLERGA